VSQELKLCPWDMPTDEKNLYGRLAAKEPEQRTALEAFGKRYADLCFDLIQTRDRLIASDAHLQRSHDALVDAARKVIERIEIIAAWEGEMECQRVYEESDIELLRAALTEAAALTEEK